MGRGEFAMKWLILPLYLIFLCQWAHVYEARRTGKEVDGKSSTGGDLCHVDSSDLLVTAKKEKEEKLLQRGNRETSSSLRYTAGTS